MKFSRNGLVILVFLLALSSTTFAQEGSPIELEASSAVLLDFESGQLLFSQNGNAAHTPASLVKIMTMYVALDQISQGRAHLQDTATISERAWRMTGSKMFLNPMKWSHLSS